MSRLSRAMTDAAEAVLNAADELNRLDAQAGDGDLGVTMATAARAVQSVLPTVWDQAPPELLRACGSAIAQKAPSTAGTLVATGLLRAARALAAPGAPEGAAAVAMALESAGSGIAERGKAELGSKTMLDSLAPAAAAAAVAAAAGHGVEAVLESASAAAETGAAATAGMRPRHGRAGWLAERSAGHEDAGARLVAIAMHAAAASVAAVEGSR